jgi:hypothetical protein
LRKPLTTVDLTTGEPAQAQSERSDVTAVPAMGVVAEAMVAIVLAQAMAEKFGGDSLGEMRGNYEAYVARLAARRSVGGTPPSSLLPQPNGEEGGGRGEEDLARDVE